MAVNVTPLESSHLSSPQPNAPSDKDHSARLWATPFSLKELEGVAGFGGLGHGWATEAPLSGRTAIVLLRLRGYA